MFFYLLICCPWANFNPFKTEAVIICSANQWTGSYMITASVLKGLSHCRGGSLFNQMLKLRFGDFLLNFADLRYVLIFFVVLLLLTPCLVVAVQPCMKGIPIKKKFCKHTHHELKMLNYFTCSPFQLDLLRCSAKYPLQT